MAIAVTDLGTATGSGTDPTTFTFASFGAEASDRVLVALVTAGDSGLGDAVIQSSGTTIGGVAATIVVQSGHSLSRMAAILVAEVPTGSSGDVVVNWAAGVGSSRRCTLLRCTGMASTASDFDSAESATSNTNPISGTVDVPAGGVAFGAACWQNDADTGTWSLGTEDADETGDSSVNSRHLAAHEIFASTQTGLTVSCTPDTAAANKAIAVASFAAAFDGNYTLAMAGGSFTMTGGSTGLLAGRKLVQSGGSFTLTGGDVTFRKGFTLVASGGSYSLTGGAATFPLTRKLAMAGGSFSLTGGATGLLAGRKLATDGGSFSLTGGDAGLLAGRKIVATGGLFSLTGGDAALTAQRILSAAGGSFALAGGDVDFRKGFTLSMLGGSFDLAGGDIDFIYVPTTPDSPVGGHFGGAYVPRKKKWRKVGSLEALDQAIRETMRPDLIVLKDGTVIPVNAIELDDEEILLLL